MIYKRLSALTLVFEKCFRPGVRHTLLEICAKYGRRSGYGNRIWRKYTAEWDVQLTGMIFQTRSNTALAVFLPWIIS
jgi:hypothetical protein